VANDFYMGRNRIDVATMNKTDIELDLLKEFDRLVKEGEAHAGHNEIELEFRYDCTRGFHKWRWYEGLKLDRFYFCELCDTKDKSRKPPSRS
jgi:hypothetical protein